MNTITTYAQHAQAILWETGRSSKVVGWGEPPLMPYTHHNGWTLNEILKSDLSSESITESEVLRRLEVLEGNGICYTHILIAHEPAKPTRRLELPPAVVEAGKKVLPALGAFLGAVAIAVGVAMVLYALLPIIVALGVLLTLPALVLYDPVVIVVLKDGTWLEIAKWYD